MIQEIDLILIFSNQTLYFGSGDMQVYAVDATSGNLIWKYTTGGPIGSSCVVLNGVVYIGSLDHNLHALQAS